MSATKTKRKAISLDIKIQILDRLQSGQGATSVGRHFGLHEATIRTIKKNEAAIRKSVCSGTNLSAKSSSYTRDIIIEKMEKVLIIWIEYKSQKRVPVDGNGIKQTALKIYKQIKEMEPGNSSQLDKKYEFSASTGWMTGFLKRHALHNIKITGETASADESAGKEFPQNLSKIIEDGGYTSDQIWNADVSGLFWKRMPNRTYVAKSQKTADPKEEDQVLNADLIKEGLELVSKLGNHFAKHDPNTERAEKFQHDLKLLMTPYREIYKGLTETRSQRLITEFINKATETSATQKTMTKKLHKWRKKMITRTFLAKPAVLQSCAKRCV